MKADDVVVDVAGEDDRIGVIGQQGQFFLVRFVLSPSFDVDGRVLVSISVVVPRDKVVSPVV